MTITTISSLITKQKLVTKIALLIWEISLRLELSIAMEIFTKGSFLMVASTAKENLLGKMAPITKEITLGMKNMAKAL